MVLLAHVPIFTEIRESGDHGIPITLALPDHPASRAFIDLARKVVAAMPAN
jgi:MinD-like ATPase involved in chromosome partitioning or flagellar assembly